MSSTDGPRRVRTSDGEREELAEIIRAAMAEGRLTLPEGEERLAAAYAATWRDELSPLVADLPDGAAAASLASGSAGPARGPAERVGAGPRPAVRPGALGRHAAVVVAVAGVLVTIWALAPVHHFFWPVFPLVFLTIGLVRHARWRRYAAGPTGPVPYGRRQPWR